MDRARTRLLLRSEAARFLRERPPDAELAAVVRKALAEPPGAPTGEAALYAAIVLAAAGDAAGLPLLREPHKWFCTNSEIEVALAQIARLLFCDLEPPLSFINATMIRELASEVGAWPPR